MTFTAAHYLTAVSSDSGLNTACALCREVSCTQLNSAALRVFGKINQLWKRTANGMLRIRARFEKVVSGHLRAKGYEAYLPLQTSQRQWIRWNDDRPVSIKDGPLSGIEGTVLQIRSGLRLIVPVTVLQRSIAVEIEQPFVKAMLPGNGKTLR